MINTLSSQLQNCPLALFAYLFTLFVIPVFAFDRLDFERSLDTIKSELSNQPSAENLDIEHAIQQIAHQIDRGYVQRESLKKRHMAMQKEIAISIKTSDEEQPEISFVIPCYNRAKCISQTLDSIYLQEWNVPFEVIVVDDCSTDNSLKFLKGYAKKYPNFFVYANEQNLRAPEARNQGFLRARGKYVFNIDSDDVLIPGTLPLFLNHVRSQQAGMGVFENLHIFSDFDFSHVKIENKIPPHPILDIHAIIDTSYNSLCAGNRVFEKKVWLNCGGYLDNDGHDSWAMSFRILARGYPVDMVPHSAYYHRTWSNANESMFFQDEQNKRHLISPLLLILENSEIFQNLDAVTNYRQSNVLIRTEFLHNPKEIFNIHLLPQPILDLHFKACRAEDEEDYRTALSCLKQLIEQGYNHPRFLFHLLLNALKVNDPITSSHAIDLLKQTDVSRFEREEALIAAIQRKARKTYFNFPGYAR